MTVSTGREFEGERHLFNAFLDYRGRLCDCGRSFLLDHQIRPQVKAKPKKLEEFTIGSGITNGVRFVFSLLTS